MERDLAAAVKSYALGELEFDLVGIADAAPLPGAARLADWLAAGSYGEMAWMADTAPVRCDPALFLSGVQSVICVAMSYHDEDEPAAMAPSADRTVIARFAQRKDYHDVIRPRLARLGRFLERQRPGARWRTAVDSAPVLERELAARAGLGWIGKNTCLIHQRLGSEILLGELFTTVALANDRPQRNHCGICTACVRACPTGALARPGTLDARRCISYLTIEHRTEIPAGLATAIGPHLAGCDICQAVCPWNRCAQIRCAPALRRRPHLDDPAQGDLRGLDEQGFLAFTAGTPLRRLRFSQFRRNLEVIRCNSTGRPAILDNRRGEDYKSIPRGDGSTPQEV